MKHIFAALVLTLAAAASLSAQTPAEITAIEQEIRAREKEQVAALLRHDTEALDKIFADELVVNAPNNKVNPKSDVLRMIEARQISYSSYEAQIEKVLIADGVVVVMGKEVVHPINNAFGAGGRFERRYTQVWAKRGGKWMLVARHANIIPPPQTQNTAK